MGREFQVERTIYSINIYQALTLSQALPVGAGDTQMALASEEVMGWGQVYRQTITSVMTR